MRHLLLFAAAVCVVTACQPSAPQQSAAERIDELADRYYEWALERTPERAYFAGVDIDVHDGLFDNSPEAQLAAEAVEDELLAAVTAIAEEELLGTPAWITKAFLEQRLRSGEALRVCRQELWSVSQMSGWQLAYAQLAALQPVGTPELREQALTRWSKLAVFIDQEIANLQSGLEQGYSAPQPVVRRVIEQVDGLLALPIEKSPFFSPAERDQDPAFGKDLASAIANGIIPAMQRYRDFLAETYLEAAREELSVVANPDGEACYAASLFNYTTLPRGGEAVYALGETTVEENRAAVVRMGRDAYGLENLREIVRAAKADPADHFADSEELLTFSRDMVKRAEAEMPNWVGTMPAQPVEVVPFLEHEEGTGRSAHYNPGNESRPGEYRIPLHGATEQSRGNAEATAFHEAWPGHHLQVATARAVEGLHPVTRIIWFSGPGEGWARYSEALAEEMGLYSTRSGPILRRAWPARGMVVDPGIHLFGWTREQAIEFMSESGRFSDSVADDLVDRIAILPGQLTAYDSGGLEIIALRRLAKERLGDDFDIRVFHDRILENGTIPLTYLRTHIERWLDTESAE
jgi:uncharacterized protein (DUF885 family)